ncbi:SGNH/GDSL hydrolase family protein [Mycobacterium sp. 852014-52144_SCH5372336]|uniref:SGNH/GDSL hydrolase family protein n=1 Tax=Mycobacterium sp. 852014-52144_SCH5372336 TaxID=1834115 RepID=UPI0012E82471|nr:SGNH/GDSL hydrolase family protein [Mycobacterium sp. 852014-52144_SCH5372336]
MGRRRRKGFAIMATVQFRRILLTLLSLLAAAVTVLAFEHVGGTPASARGDRPERLATADPPTVLFVGDSFTAGAGVQNVIDAYPALIAKSARWDVKVDAQGATGFIADGRGTGNGDTSKLIDRLPNDKQAYPDVNLLVVDAGRCDLEFPTDDIAAAMAEYLQQARMQWPDAEIVQILPAFMTASPYDAYPDLLQKMKSNLDVVNGTLIDPFAEGWYANADVDSMVDSDNVHPNWLGSAHIADRLVESFHAKGLISGE